jgi:hypothetical protein
MVDHDSDIFCGHEYAIQNITWGMAVENKNQVIKDYYADLIKQQSEYGVPCSIPSSLKK